MSAVVSRLRILDHFSVRTFIGQVVDRLEQAGLVLEAGLTDFELHDVEGRLGFEFSHEHRELLSMALPLGDGWVDWRHGDTAQIARRLAWPVEGVLFDVENNEFWPATWGGRPAEPEAALRIASARLDEVPQLIPVFSHRYLPAGPREGHSPVLSVHQTDVIYYGGNLLDYVAHEFRVPPRHQVEPQRVPFWTHLVEGMETDFWTER